MTLKVYIILVNWNGWKDTIECLESVFRLDYSNFAVCVCDNGSTDGSLDRIEEWAKGARPAACHNHVLEGFTTPPVPKPLSCLRVGAGAPIGTLPSGAQLILLQTGCNLGFAGANNSALRLLAANGDVNYFWLLNNDTVVDPQALNLLVGKMETERDLGICGSTLLYYSDPNTVQALGGSRFNRWTARGGHIGVGLPCSTRPGVPWVEQRLKYVVGASMLVSRSFLEQVGLMNEGYFLYFEEIDWAIRAKGRFRLGYCPDSIVYHKEGSSIGTARQSRDRSLASEFYSTRNRVVFTRTYFPYAMPSVCASILTSAFHRLFLGRVDRFKAVVRGLISGLAASAVARRQNQAL